MRTLKSCMIKGWSCQLHDEKGVEGTTFHNVHTQKGEK